MVVTSIAPATSNLTEVRAEETEDLGVNLASDATAEAAFINPYVEGAAGMNDGYFPKADAPKSWNCRSAPEEKYPMEVSLTWGGPQTMTSMRVMWWADGGEVKWPGAATVEYLAEDGITWGELGDVGAEVGDINGANSV